MAIENIKVPDLGDATEVEVIELLVSVGDQVEKNDSLLVLESDKAAMEIPAPMAGTVKSIAVNLGDQVKTGNDMLSLEVAAGDSEDEDKDDADGQTESRQSGGGEDDSESASKAQQAEDSEPEPEPEPEPESAQDAGGGTETIDAPDLGTDEEVEIIEVHVKPGDEIDLDDSLITLESDKAAMEVPATTAGKVEEVFVKVGDKIRTGDSILKISGAEKSATTKDEARSKKQDDKKADKKADKKEDRKQDDTKEDDTKEDRQQDRQASKDTEPGNDSARESKPAPGARGKSGGKVYAGPAVRKLARELGVDLTLIKGTGARNRIVKEDVHEFVKSSLAGGSSAATAPGIASIPDIDFSQFGETEKVERSKLDKLTAVNMQRNWSAIPHVAQFNEADVTDLEDFRAELKSEAEKRGTKLTFLPFLLKACARALAEYPQFNVSLHSSGEYLIQKKYFHIGIAVATPAGLVVPVIRDVDKKSIWELSEEVLSLSKKARDRKLSREEMQGACFTISSLGPIGGTGFIPIINAPEVAILGIARTDIKPVYIDGEFVPRKMLPFTLSYDHKAVNGVDGGQFSDYLARLLSDIRHLAL